LVGANRRVAAYGFAFEPIAVRPDTAVIPQDIRSMPIRLSPTATTCRERPIA
jgi:hypothetical protein